MPGSLKSEETTVDVDDERYACWSYHSSIPRLTNSSSNAQNDALLHRLVHTELLTGSPNSMLNLSAARRRKALAGRVLELSGGAMLGKGQKYVVEQERNKAAKRVRDGLVEKQKARVKQELEEVSIGVTIHVWYLLIQIMIKAKNLGNYHPTIKKLFKSSTGPANAKRDRGLKMGVGKFSGGFLKLSQKEVSLAQGFRGQRSNHGRHSRRRSETKS
jgi:hypothetical protein